MDAEVISTAKSALHGVTDFVEDAKEYVERRTGRRSRRAKLSPGWLVVVAASATVLVLLRRRSSEQESRAADAPAKEWPS
jgi:hypothetical protein